MPESLTRGIGELKIRYSVSHNRPSIRKLIGKASIKPKLTFCGIWNFPGIRVPLDQLAKVNRTIECGNYIDCIINS